MTPDDAQRDIVLVVDDSPETLSFLTDALEEAGITVLVAIDGESALALVEQITPDLVLLDGVMPGLDGFATCRRLKSNPALAHLPVIFMTGLAETEHIVMGLEAGGVDYVTKPIVVTQLMARIRVHLGNARRTLSARAALDASGRFLLALDRAGAVLWRTPQAARLLGQAFPGFETSGFALTPLAQWLDETRRQPRPRTSPGFTLVEAGHRFDFSYLGQTGPDEFLLRVTETQPGADEAYLKDYLGLTLREADVLLWIGRGKSNRDISDILGISPRTVNKHLEQIYEKLGVENRSSAAAIAAKALEQRG